MIAAGPARAGRAAFAFEERAQAVVELAIVAPVLLVLALVTYNLMTFAAAVARFDRIVPDVVIAQAVSPGTGQDACSAVQAELERSMEGYGVELEVEEAVRGLSSGDALMTLAPGCVTYRCTMRYAPAPSTISLAGVHVDVPAFLVHAREVTCDPWRSGVVA